MIYPEKDVNVLSVQREYGDEPIVTITGNVFATPNS
jgi:hypothetical protein